MIKHLNESTKKLVNRRFKNKTVNKKIKERHSCFEKKTVVKKLHERPSFFKTIIKTIKYKKISIRK